MAITRETLEAELPTLPDEAFIHGERLSQILDTGMVFRGADGRALICLGFARRQVWDDAEDGWVWRRVPGCRPATAEEIEWAGFADAAPAAEKSARWAIKAGTEYTPLYAIAGRTQKQGATAKSPEKATTWATREEAESALPGIAAAAPAYFGARYNPAIVPVEV